MKTKNITMAACFAAITAVFAQIIFPLPFTPVHVTLSVCAVYLAGAILPKSYAVYSQLIYLLLGIVGLPVFGKFSGGIGVIMGPTGGYLLVYPVMAFCVAFILEKLKSKAVWAYLVSMTASLMVCYIGGSLWFSMIAKMSWTASLKMTVLPFVVIDLIKIVAFSFIAVALNHALEKAKLKAITQ